MQQWGGLIKVKDPAVPSKGRPCVLIAMSAPCDEAFQQAWATEGFYFQLNGGSGVPFDAIGRLGQLCVRYPQMVNVHINCFNRDASVSLKQWLRFQAFPQRLSSCHSITVSTVPGMKGLFWKHALRPLDTDVYDYLWLSAHTELALKLLQP
jgi:hypothetical protein